MPDDTPPFRYTAALADEIERRWQSHWETERTFVVPNPGDPAFDASRPKFYCLDMFPYPSGAGLHVGHPEGYTATDILCRYKRMCGFNVLHPMGYDAFGLPAEQFAIQTGVHPAITTKKSIATFRRQLQRFGFCYDWSREVATTDPEYYRWTQWVFLRLYDAWYDRSAENGRGRARPISELMDSLANERIGVGLDGEIVYLDGGDGIAPVITGSYVGVRRARDLSAAERRAFIDARRLAYVGETTVNWCPALGTVLANDEVIDGKSERGGHPVLRKPLKQWMFRITAYAQRLLDDLGPLDWPASTKTQQSEWIGRSEGAEIEFEVVGRLSEPTPPSSTTSPSGLHPFDSPRSVPCTAPGFVARNPYPPGDPTPDDLVMQVRNLPHLIMPGATYFVTWRVQGWRLNERGRDAVMRALMHFDGERCDVYAACVMDTHVHWVVRPYAGVDLRKLTESVKRFSANEVNAIETMSGPLWQPDAFDHVVRDAKWFGAFLWYCARNPVEAGLARSVRDYRWSYVSPRARNGTGVAVGVGAHWAKRGVNGEVVDVGSESRPTFRVFTTRPDTLFGATYMVVAPEHELVDAVLESPGSRTDVNAVRAYVAAARNRSDVERMESKEKTGVDLGVDAINPATGKPIPVWVADYVLMSYGTGAIMAVPSGDERDFEFATMFNLPIVRVVEPPAGVKIAPDACYSGEGVSVNSSNAEVSLDGLSTPDAKARIIEWLERKGIGRRRVNYKLRDWTFSRQRYWGEPFPIVYDDAGNHYGVNDAALPVVLPELADYKPVESEDPAPLLEKATNWVHTTAGKAGVAGLPPQTPVRRETNTMPGSAGSSWYFLRYCDAHNNARFVGKQAEAYWMKPPRDGAIGGVDFYVGGNEHAVGHLLYSRFWHKVLYDLGHVSTPEPFQRLFHQGLITAYSYQRPDKTLVPTDQVEELPPEGSGKFVEKGAGTPLVPVVAKMSKSLKNVVNPDDIISQYGADTFRLYEMYMGPLEASKPWNTRDMIGLFRFLQRVWRNMIDESTGACTATDAAPDDATLRLLHKTIAGVRKDVEAISFNTAIAKLIELNNHLATVSQAAGGMPRAVAEPFTLMLAPFAPHVAEELWQRLGHAKTLTDERFPEADPALLVESRVEIAVQVLGKVRGRIMVPAGAEPEAIEALVLADPQVQQYLGGKPVKKIIVVPGRLVNFVV